MDKFIELALKVVGESFVDRCQFVRRCLVFGTGEYCLDFERNLCQLLLSVLRPG